MGLFETLFGDKQANNFKRCVDLIEAAFGRLDLDPSECLADVNEKEGCLTWAFTRGASDVLVFLRVGDDSNFIQVSAPILHLPDANILPLYRRLLELNADELLDSAFGVRGDQVILTSDRSTDGLDATEVETMITSVAEYAHQYTDDLITEFGGRRASESPTE